MTAPKTPWRFTPEVEEQLRKIATEGKVKTMAGAARALGVDRNTLVRGAKRVGKQDWLEKKFPSNRAFSNNMRKHPSESHQQRMMRALTTAWR